MATELRVQHSNTPLGTVVVARPGQSAPVYVSTEWFRAIDEMVQKINELQARVTALGG